jgi:hypothetical protein
MTFWGARGPFLPNECLWQLQTNGKGRLECSLATSLQSVEWHFFDWAG